MKLRSIQWSILLLVSLCILMLTGCPDIGQDPPSDWSYETRPVAIYNPDWGVIPLPNNFLNPVQQAEIPVSIPGVVAEDAKSQCMNPNYSTEEAAANAPICMNLPYTDQTAAEKQQARGYDVQSDSLLTTELLTGQNKLNGFMPGFIPKIPFSKELDMDSLVPFEAELNSDGTIKSSNAAEANFFLLDVTDPEKPTPVATDKYYRVFNYELSDQMPFYLTLRNTPSVLLPDDYEVGHTYLVVMTGTDHGVKDIDGLPVEPDSFFLLFASEEAFFQASGAPKNNLLKDPNDPTQPDIPGIQEAEGARQIINWGLNIWQGVVGDSWQRNQVVTTFHFSIATNPMPTFMDAARVVLGQNPILATPTDYFKYDSNGEIEFIEADATCLPQPKFSISLAIDSKTVTNDNIKLYEMANEDGSELSEIPLTGISISEDDKTLILDPAETLTPHTSYFVAVTNGLKDPDGWATVDQSYFGITRATTPLVEDGQWMSPHLDSRIDTLIFMLNSGQLSSLSEIGEDDLAAAGDTLIQVLSIVEESRKRHEGPITWLVDKGVIPTREDIVMGWTFTTGDCSN